MINIILGFKKVYMAMYAMYLTNIYGIKLKKTRDSKDKMDLRLQYSLKLLKKLNISINILNENKIPLKGQYLLISNHRSIIDPLIIEITLKNSNVKGYWVAKKELYNSFFFGSFTRNAGCILLNRKASNMTTFFTKTKEVIKEGQSIFIFPEGTRNKENTSLNSFKEGSRIIALKNRIDILPIYIKTNAHKILKQAIEKRIKNLTIDVQIGEIIDYKNKTPLEDNYKKQFKLDY